jgi:hypothetical protein
VFKAFFATFAARLEAPTSDCEREDPEAVFDTEDSEDGYETA